MALTPLLALLLDPGEGTGGELPIKITHHTKQEAHKCRQAKSTTKLRGAHETNLERVRDTKREFPGFRVI
jgi:hypothetical protein